MAMSRAKPLMLLPGPALPDVEFLLPVGNSPPNRPANPDGPWEVPEGSSCHQEGTPPQLEAPLLFENPTRDQEMKSVSSPEPGTNEYTAGTSFFRPPGASGSCRQTRTIFVHDI